MEAEKPTSAARSEPGQDVPMLSLGGLRDLLDVLEPELVAMRLGIAMGVRVEAAA